VKRPGPDVRAFLSRTACRFHLIQLPPYCPHLNPIERLWAVLHQYVTHNRYYPSQKLFADAILAFMRETIPQEWTKFRDKVSDNFRVITHENFRVLK
jgi:transposase